MPRQQAAEPPLPPGYAAQDWGIPEKPASERNLSGVNSAARATAQGLIGAGKGVLSTTEGLATKYQQALDLIGAPKDPAYVAQQRRIPQEMTVPSNTAQGVGHAIEQGAEYLLGGAGAARMGGGLLAQMAAQGLTAGGIAGLHGASAEEAAGAGAWGAGVTGAIGAGMKGAGMAARYAGDLFQNSKVGRIINWIGNRIEPRQAEFVDTPTPPPTAPPVDVASRPLGRTSLPLPGPTPRPRGAGVPGEGPGTIVPEATPPRTALPTRQLGDPLPPGPPQLPPAPGHIVPRGTESLPGDPRLPSVYQQTPGPISPSGVMGRIQEGIPGPIAAHGEQTITGMTLPLERIPKGQPGAGTFRRVTQPEAVASKGTAGRTARDLPTAPGTSPKRRVYDRLIELMEQEAKQAKPPTKESLLSGGKVNPPSTAAQKLRDELEAEFLKDKLIPKGGAQPKSPTGVERRAGKPAAPPKKPPKK